jgi:hypothetical protein
MIATEVIRVEAQTLDPGYFPDPGLGQMGFPDFPKSRPNRDSPISRTPGQIGIGAESRVFFRPGPALGPSAPAAHSLSVTRRVGPIAGRRGIGRILATSIFPAKSGRGGGRGPRRGVGFRGLRAN